MTDDMKKIALEWDDIRYRLSGGKYGAPMIKAKDKQVLVRAMIAKSRKDYDTACKLGYGRAANSIKMQIEVLEAMARDYAE